MTALGSKIDVTIKHKTVISYLILQPRLLNSFFLKESVLIRKLISMTKIN